LFYSVVFWIIVIAGDIQLSPNRYLSERQEMESQKFPVVANVIIETGNASIYPHLQTYERMRGF
jgi:hypothetical protein